MLLNKSFQQAYQNWYHHHEVSHSVFRVVLGCLQHVCTSKRHLSVIFTSCSRTVGCKAEQQHNPQQTECTEKFVDTVTRVQNAIQASDTSSVLDQPAQHWRGLLMDGNGRTRTVVARWMDEEQEWHAQPYRPKSKDWKHDWYDRTQRDNILWRLQWSIVRAYHNRPLVG